MSLPPALPALPPCHPKASDYELMSRPALEELGEDIKQNGQHHAIIYSNGPASLGLLIDGRNRWLACQLAGVVPWIKVQDFQTEEEIIAFIEGENDIRRHESQELQEKKRAERRARIIAKAQDKKSLRTIAKEEGISHEQVRQELIASGVNRLTPSRPRLSISTPEERTNQTLYDEAVERQKERKGPTPVTFRAEDTGVSLPESAPSLANEITEDKTQTPPESQKEEVSSAMMATEASNPCLYLPAYVPQLPSAEQCDDGNEDDQAEEESEEEEEVKRYIHWNTPPEVVEMIERLGDIDLDPCSNSFAKTKAKRFFTAEDDGLSKDWGKFVDGPYGLVYINPPYSTAGQWARKCAEQSVLWPCLDFVFLVPARTGARWFHDWILETASAVCWWRGRIQFWKEGKPVKGSANFDPCFALWGPSVTDFIEIFGTNFKGEPNKVHNLSQMRQLQAEAAE